VLAGWLASGAWRHKWDAVRGNRVALAALALYALLLAGALFGAATPGDARATLGKYLDLLWIPVLVWLFRESAVRKRALYALAASLALVLAASFLLMADLLPHAPFVKGDPSTPFVMKTRQTHGLLMAFGAFLFLKLALEAASPRSRILWGVLAALAVANGTLVVPGGTGYVVLATLALYLGYVWKGWRGVAAAVGAVSAVVAVLMAVPGPFQQRVLRTQSEIAEWRPGIAGEGSSTGQRMEFYRVSLEIAKDRPLLGHGTGSFTSAYAEKMKGQQAMLTRNPHNEYLHWLVQLGVVGLAALLYLFWTHWRSAAGLSTPFERDLARGLVLTMAVGCLFNSWLMDHTEGLLYVWLTGLLFAGLKSPESITRRASRASGSG
jgi:O-antigen ligase